MGEGREGDWECNGCRNRNYAFRFFCNRCKQPRILVDNKTPADSKWLPRIGDWICSGCTNNNYASREKCKKCGQPKEVAAMPAIAMPGASLPTYSHYFARVQGGGGGGVADQRMNVGLIGNGAFQQSLPLASNWPVAGQPTNTWSFGGNPNPGIPYANPTNQLLSVPKGWRNGDWLCTCGFHNYSSREQCKKCNAFPPGLGTKRLASEEFVHDWDNKRLNIGHTQGQHQSHLGFEPLVGAIGDSKPIAYTPYPNVSFDAASSLQNPMQSPHQPTAPTLLGKGAKQWREGDWMCKSCNNHNYASRSQCNRCKTERDGVTQSVDTS